MVLIARLLGGASPRALACIGPIRDSVAGVTSHGLSCGICKCKAHKRCAAKAVSNCKWTTLASVGKDIIEDDDGVRIFTLQPLQRVAAGGGRWRQVAAAVESPFVFIFVKCKF